MRKRRLKKAPAALEVSAFINLIVVLVPFLLSTTVFTRLAIMELSLPAQSSSFERLTGELQLEVVVRADGLDDAVLDEQGRLLDRLAGCDDDRSADERVAGGVARPHAVDRRLLRVGRTGNGEREERRGADWLHEGQSYEKPAISQASRGKTEKPRLCDRAGL